MSPDTNSPSVNAFCSGLNKCLWTLELQLLPRHESTALARPARDVLLGESVDLISLINTETVFMAQADYSKTVLALWLCDTWFPRGKSNSCFEFFKSDLNVKFSSNITLPSAKGISRDVFYHAIGDENRSHIHFSHVSENLTEMAFYPKIKHKNAFFTAATNVDMAKYTFMIIL